MIHDVILARPALIVETECASLHPLINGRSGAVGCVVDQLEWECLPNADLDPCYRLLDKIRQWKRIDATVSGTPNANKYSIWPR